jgi:hypothetical protein
MSICRECSVSRFSFAMLMAAFLSSYSNVGPDGEKPSAMRMDRSYLATLVASTAAMNSLSVLLIATVSCSFDLKAMAPPARQKDKPVTDATRRRNQHAPGGE